MCQVEAYILEQGLQTCAKLKHIYLSKVYKHGGKVKANTHRLCQCLHACVVRSKFIYMLRSTF